MTDEKASEIMKKNEQQSRIVEFDSFAKEKEKENIVEVFCDVREKEIAQLLIEEGANVTLRQLDVGDFLISDRMCVERKTSADFEASIIDGRLFEQASRLEEYDFPIIIIEGEMKAGRISQSAFLGAIMALIVDFGMHVINTKDNRDSAHVIFLLAKREQHKDKRPIRFIEKKKALTFKHQQLRVLQAFPQIGPTLAKKLLDRFHSLHNIFQADIKELEAVLGKAKARTFYSLIVHKSNYKDGIEIES